MGFAPEAAKRQPASHEKALRRVSLAFLLGFAAMAGLAASDFSNHDTLESLHLPTAVGDENYFPIPAKRHLEEALGRFNGKDIFPLRFNESEIEEFRLLLVTKDKQKGVTLYRRVEKSADEEAEERFYVKTGRNRFLRVRLGE